jgi:hypothetical protein
MKHWHLVEKDGNFHQTGTEDGSTPPNPRRLKVVEVAEHTNDPHCHRYVAGKLVFDAEKRARLDRETEILMMPREEIARRLVALETRFEALERKRK